MKKLLIFIFLAIISIFLTRNIIIKQSLKYYLSSNLGIEASFREINTGFGKIVLDETDLVKDDFQFRAKNIEFRYKFDFLDYQLSVNDLSIQGDQIGDFSLSLRLKKDKIYFYDLESTFIDSSAVLSGAIDLGNLNNICIDLAAKDLPLSDIVFLFADKKEIALEGKFSGKINCCFKKNKISYLDLDIDNLEGGVINLKKETSLDFLKKRVDKKSYSYLLDNLKNYKYDEGSIKANLDKNDIVFRANFSSKELGERNITIKLHEVFAE